MDREILLTNDDSVSANGIRYFAEILRDYGNVTIVAPRDPPSAKSASLTMGYPLLLSKVKYEEELPGRGSLTIYNLTGTPCDCTKFGMNMFISQGKMPDFVLSGINHGSNAAAAAIYSGTLGAVKEVTLYGIPSMGFSLCSHLEDPDFSVVDFFGRKILERFFESPPAKGVYLHVNFPYLPIDEIKGIRFARQGAGRWIREFVRLEEPKGREFYWMTGEFVSLDSEQTEGYSADHLLNGNGYVSIVAHRIDTTDYTEIERLDNLWNL